MPLCCTVSGGRVVSIINVYVYPPVQLDEIRAFQSEASEWLYGEGMEVPAEQYRERLDKLAAMTKPIFHRRDGTLTLTFL